MLNTQGRAILKAKLMNAYKNLAYYQELRYTLKEEGKAWWAAYSTLENNYKTWWNAYCTLENLAGALCEYENVHKWLGITEKDKEVAKAKGIAEAKRYAVEDTEEISF